VAKHRLKQDDGVRRSVRGVLVAGAVTVGAMALTAGPAVAQTITIPGLGNFEIPDMPPPPQIPPLPQLPTLQLPGFPTAPGPSTHARLALAAAESKVGAPYVWGAAGPSTFDCSGLVQWSYKQAGVAIPRTTYGQADAGTPVAKNDLQPGDVVLFDGGGHEAIYAGNGTVVHAPTEGQPVKHAPLDSMPFYAARRY